VQPTHGPHRNPEETEVLRNQLKFLARLQDGELPLQFHDLSSFMFVQLPKYLENWILHGQQCFQFGTSRQVFFLVTQKAILFLQMILKFETPQINIMTKTHHPWQQARFLGNNHDPAPCTIH